MEECNFKVILISHAEKAQLFVICELQCIHSSSIICTILALNDFFFFCLFVISCSDFSWLLFTLFLFQWSLYFSFHLIVFAFCNQLPKLIQLYDLLSVSLPLFEVRNQVFHDDNILLSSALIFSLLFNMSSSTVSLRLQTVTIHTVHAMLPQIQNSIQ